jgi:hypothetical protein
MNENHELNVQIEGKNIDNNILYKMGVDLRRELLEVGAENVSFATETNHESGTKSVDPVVIGALVIAVAPPVLTKLLDFLQAWMMRQQSRVVKIKIQLDSLEIEVPETMSRSEVEQWINALKKNLKSKKS